MRLLEALIQLAAELPDIGSPMFPVLCARHGAFVGGALAWRRGRPIGPVATGGSVVGFGVGYIIWLSALAIDLL